MRELAKYRKSEELEVDVTAVYGSKLWDPKTWDADMIQGCAADIYGYFPGTVHNITNTYTQKGEYSLECPYGLDNRDQEYAQKNDTSLDTRTYWLDPRKFERETQRVLCTANGGTFTISFRNFTTTPIAYDASPESLEAALEFLPSIGDVSVSVMPSSDVPGQVCSGTAATDHYFDLVFETELSKVALVVLDDTALTHTTPSDKVLSVTETVAGRGTLKECSGKGECDRSTGQCLCWPTWGSSDGYGNRGTRGDCGYSLVH
jgi:hypothetical protein